LTIAAFLAGEGVSRRVAKVPQAMRELVEKLRQEVQDLADREPEDPEPGDDQ
jgi:hypothetical protein